MCGWKREGGSSGGAMPDVCDRGRPPWISLDPGWWRNYRDTALRLFDNYRFRPTSEGEITSAWKKRKRNVSVVKQKVMLNAASPKYGFAQSQEAYSTLWVFWKAWRLVKSNGQIRKWSATMWWMPTFAWPEETHEDLWILREGQNKNNFAVVVFLSQNQPRRSLPLFVL